MVKHNDFSEENMHQMQYALLTEVMGRWKADISEAEETTGEAEDAE